jgi:hypothetical protein
MESAGGSAETPLPFGQQRQGFLGLAPAAGDVGTSAGASATYVSPAKTLSQA